MMRLNLAGITTSDSQSKSDHTPTPTRFIRNCEEVGLFQDLQNVNPFEEGFRKALNSSDKKLTLECLSNNDDTLHTPNIIPTISNITSLAISSKCNQLVNTNENVFALKHTGSETKVIDLTKDSLKSAKKIKYTVTSKEKLEKRRESNRKAAKKAYIYRNAMIAKNQLEIVRLKDENFKLKIDNECLVKRVQELEKQLQLVTNSAKNDDKTEEAMDITSSDKVTLPNQEIDGNLGILQQAVKPRFILPKIAFDERGSTSNIICLNNSFVIVNNSNQNKT